MVMAATSSRTLRLLTLLQGRRFWSGSELSGRLEVSLRTLRWDVDRLRELGYPVEARPGVDGGYSLAPGAALPPLVLDDDEAVALAVGLQAAAQLAVPAHLIFRKPILLSCRDDVRVLAGKTFVGESAGLDGGRLLNCDSVLRRCRHVPQRRQIVVREDPGAEVGDNGIRVGGGFGGFDVKEI